MRMTRLFALATLLFAGAVEAATSAGSLTMLTGRGTASDPAGNIRTLSKGAEVFPGEVINTGANSYANIKFRDGSFILLRPKSRFQIEEFDYPGETPPPKKASSPAPSSSAPAVASSGEQSSSRAFFRLLKGGLRAVTGLVGRVDRNEYRVATPVATIGIRGTDYIVVICDAACAADPIIANALPPGTVSPDGGVVVGVITGGVFVANNTGASLGLEAGEYGLAIGDTVVDLGTKPPADFIRNAIPNPESCE